MIKKVDTAISAGDAEQARAAYDSAVPVIDRMADKGIIHKNKAARHKSRLNAQVKALAALSLPHTKKAGFEAGFFLL